MVCIVHRGKEDGVAVSTCRTGSNYHLEGIVKHEGEKPTVR